MWSGQRRFDLVVRLRDDRRNNLEAIRTLLIDGHDGTKIPLGQLADITQTFGPASIRREAGTRRIAVEASVTGPRSRRARPPKCAQRLAAQLKLPSGYFFDLAGRVESQARASRALTIAIARGALRRVRAAQHRARVGRRGVAHPGDRADRVRRRHPGAARRRRDVERVVAGRAHRAVRHRRAEQPRAGDAVTRARAGGPDHRRGACARRASAACAQADDGRRRRRSACCRCWCCGCTAPRSSGRWRS